MKIIEVQERTPALIEGLVKLWESSVKATHLFLPEGEIQNIKEYVPQALEEIPHLIVAEKENAPVGFMGIAGQKLEMLFLSPEKRGKGIGKALLQYGVERYGVNELTVNEQNPQARGFYEHMGFRVHKRAERDEQGNPYPIMYMRMKRGSLPCEWELRQRGED